MLPFAWGQSSNLEMSFKSEQKQQRLYASFHSIWSAFVDELFHSFFKLFET